MIEIKIKGNEGKLEALIPVLEKKIDSSSLPFDWRKWECLDIFEDSIHCSTVFDGVGIMVIDEEVLSKISGRTGCLISDLEAAISGVDPKKDIVFTTVGQVIDYLMEDESNVVEQEGGKLTISDGDLVFTDEDGDPICTNISEIIIPAKPFIEEEIPDKALVECWYSNEMCSRVTRFYDANNNCTFCGKGTRDGFQWDNYKLILPENEPDWAKEARKKLED